VAPIVRALLQSKAEVAVADADGLTPLHWAARAGNLEIVGLLVRAGASVNAQDGSGQTPLHWAARGHFGVSELLLVVGSDPHVRDGRGRRPAYWAEHEERDDILSLLASAASQREMLVGQGEASQAELEERAAMAAEAAGGTRRRRAPGFVDVEL